MNYKIHIFEGDGIGKEIVQEAIKTMNVISECFGHKFIYTFAPIGGQSIDELGTPLSDEALSLAKDSDAVLLGAVGGSKWDNLKGQDRPEYGLLKLRKEMGLFCNLRPVELNKGLEHLSPLKEDRINGVDICIVRELTGGIYFGERGRSGEGEDLTAYDQEAYAVKEIRRIAHMGFETAMKRNKRLKSIDKMNVLESSRLWRDVVNEVSADYPEVELTHMLVDNCAMQLIHNPAQFDTVLTNNIFGDILSDEASMLSGSIGLLPSASLNASNQGLYEPIHGSAPDIAGMKIANPVGTIKSAAMLLRYSLGLEKEADVIGTAVEQVLAAGNFTKDLYRGDGKLVNTEEMGDLIAAEILKICK